MRGYVLDGTPQDIQLLPGQEQTLTFKNKRSGSLTVKKLDGVTREPLPGVEFKITYADGRVVADFQQRDLFHGQPRRDCHSRPCGDRGGDGGQEH